MNTASAQLCVDCGRVLEAGEFTQILQAHNLARRVERTAHFLIHVSTGSFADQRAAEVGRSLEKLLAAACALLDLDEAALGRCRVYLADFLADPARPDETATAGSWIAAERGDVCSIYRPDAPGVDLDKVVLQLLLWRATGNDLAGQPLLWNALLALCQREPDQTAATAVNQSLWSESKGHMPSLAVLWSRPRQATQPSQIEWLAVLSFLDFVRGRAGGVSLKGFVEQVVARQPEEAASVAGARSLLALEKAWWKALRRAAVARPSSIGRFLRKSFQYLRPFWPKQLAIFGLLAVQLAFQQILPFSQRLLIDRAIIPGDLHYLALLIAALLGLVVLTLLASVVNDMLISRVSEAVMRGLREQMFTKLQRLSHRFYARFGTADILSRFLSDLRSVEQGLTNTLTSGAFMMLTLVVSLIHILIINWALGLLVSATLPLFYLTTRLLGPPATRASLVFAEEQAAVTTMLQENLQAHPVIKAFNLQPSAISRFQQVTGRLYHAAVRFFFLSSLFGVGANLLTSIVQIGVLGIGGYFVIRAQLHIGNLFEFLALLGLVIGPVQGISGLLQGIQMATVAMDRVEEVLDSTPDVRDAESPAEIAPLAKAIRFQDVTFSYRGDQPQLDGISLDIPAGKSVAFVGPSGSGKSTIINLIMRFYDPDRGQVLFDDQDGRAISLDSLRRQIGLVFQENFLFDTSVRENIRFGRENATDAEVEQAAKLAEIDEAVLQLPQGYDTVVGERGGTLSGGQRQRLAIARAILRQPSILVLDEATSALDPRTENAINHTLASLGRGRTTVAVTHRLATAMTADRIFVLDRGQLVEQGTHDELLRLRGLYRRLYEEQAGILPGGAAEGNREVAYLRNIPLFAELSEDAVRQIAAMLQTMKVSADADVITAGMTPDRMFIVTSGDLEVLTAGGEQEQVLASLGPGAYLGDAALLRDLLQPATVRARTDAELLTLSKESLAGLMQGVPSLRRQLEAAAAAQVTAGRSLELAGGGEPGAEAARLEQVAGAGAPRALPLIEAEIGLGRNATNDLVVDDRFVSGFHTRIRRASTGRYLAVDSGSTNGTLVNDERIEEPVELHDGDRLQLGETKFVFRDASGKASAVTPEAAADRPREHQSSAQALLRDAPREVFVEVTAGGGAGRMFPVAGELTLGRGSANDVPIPDRAVSIRHAQLEQQPGGRFAVVDLESANGTSVNGERITGRTVLRDGDTIKIGTTALVFHDGMPAHTSTE